MISAIIRFLLSLNTSLVIFAVCMLVAFIGSIMLPSNLAIFSGIDDTPLFLWLATEGVLRATWWIYVFIIAMSFMAISTFTCLADDVSKGYSLHTLIKRLSPQLVHLGTLLALLGYLLTSSYGIREDKLVHLGETVPVAGEVRLSLEQLDVEEDEYGYYTGWDAKVRIENAGGEGISEWLRPARPLSFSGYGFFIRSIIVDDIGKSAVIRVSRDPGVLWALFGGAMLLVGALGTLYVRFRA